MTNEIEKPKETIMNGHNDPYHLPDALYAYHQAMLKGGSVQKEYDHIWECIRNEQKWAVEQFKLSKEYKEPSSLKALLESVVEDLEGEKEKHGFMPLGKSDDPWNKALNLAQEKLRKLIK